MRDATRGPRGDHLAQINQSFGLLQLPPVADEEPLVREAVPPKRQEGA